MQNKSSFNIFFIGDIIGSSGLKSVLRMLSSIKKKYNIDYIIANAENANEGFGVNERIAESLFGVGVNVITTGNHVWHDFDKNEAFLKSEKRILVPANYSIDLHKFYKGMLGDVEICVVNLQGRIRMNEIDCPFRTADKILKSIKNKAIVIVDMHADCVSEKEALASYLDGRVTGIFGTHTHIQTDDARILKNGSAYISDVGGTCVQGGVIGFNYDISIKRYLENIPYKNEVLDGDAVIHSVLLTVSKETLKAVKLEPLKLSLEDFE